MAKKLRKALIAVTTLQDKAGSFVNLTATKLHIRKLVLSQQIHGTLVAGDRAGASVDEVPEYQADDNDSRSNILELETYAGNITTSGSLALGLRNKDMMIFDQGELTLDPDDAIFLNTKDILGAPTVNTKLRVWYHD